MKIVIYLGVLFMPDKNAAAHRAAMFSKMILELGFQPVVIGMNENLNEEKKDIISTKRIIDEYTLFETAYPKDAYQWLRMITSITEIKKVINYYGENNIEAIIAMDYFSIGLIKLVNYCSNKQISIIGDSVDWFEKSKEYSIKGIIKNIDTNIRMKLIYKKYIKNMITISSFLFNEYSKTCNNIVEIPGAVLKQNFIYQDFDIDFDNQKINLCFVGAPGNKCEKEKIDWLISIICSLNKYNGNKFKFYIAGIDKETLLKYRTDLFIYDNIDSSIVFLGKISHDKCLSLVSKCDFSTIIREDTLLSRAGFPTKLAESFNCGTPVIVTPSSNIKEYINTNYGFVSKSCEYEDVKLLLKEVESVNKESINDMKSVIKSENPLAYSKFTDELSKVINNSKKGK